MNFVKWTVLSRRWGAKERQVANRFNFCGGFADAKKIALTKIKDRMYEGLYGWTQENFDWAVRKAKEQRAKKKKMKSRKFLYVPADEVEL